MIVEIIKGVFVLSLAKKKLAKILTNAKAITPKPKNINASEVTLTSCSVNDPYPNKPLTISSAAIINPKLAGIDSNKDNSKDLF